MKTTRLLLKSSCLIAPALALAVFTGCDRNDKTHATTANNTAAENPDMYSANPPPLAQSEVMVASPGPDYVWVSGYWGWRAGDTPHTWVKGHWERPPHANATWVEPRWDARGKGYVFVPGEWK